MNRIPLRSPKHEPSRRTLALSASCFLLATSAALAAGAYDPAAAQSRYQAERGACLSGQTHQDRTSCLREAGAAREEARRGQIDSGTVDYERNATMRCQPLPAEERRDCLARMHGQGTTRGSVEDGGIYREMVTREIGERPPAEAAPPAAPPPVLPTAPLPTPRPPAP